VKSSRLLFYALVGLMGVILIAGGYGYVWARQMLISKKEAVEQTKLEVVDEQKRTEQLVTLSRRYEQAKTKLEDINRALPRDSQQTEILLAIQNAAKDSGVILPSIQFTGAAQLTNPQLNQSSPAQGFYVVPLNLKLSGTYDQLQSFLDKLERLSRYNSVSSLSLTKTLADKNRLDIAMTLNAYLKP